MEGTWFQIVISLCFFALSSAQTASSADGTIKYIVDRVGGKSCDEVCQGRGLVCAGRNHGLPSNVEPIFQKVGIDCQPDFDTSKDDWQHSADPKYGIGGLDDGVCRGFKNVPNEIKCDAKPTDTFGRLCPCRVALTTTEPPTTTAAETTQAEQTTDQPTPAQTTQAMTTTEQPTSGDSQTTEAPISTAEQTTVASQGDHPTTAAESPPVATKHDGLTVRCTSDYMEAILDLEKFPGMDTNTMMLDDSSCKPKQVNKTHAVIETPLDGCSTTHNSTEDYLHYYNNIRISRKKKNSSSNAIITRDHEALFPFKCSYNKKIILSVVSFSPRKKLVHTSVADYGNFTFTMDMYKSDKYKETHDKYPVIVNLGQRVYLEVKAQSKDGNLVLFPQRCHATPTNDANHKEYYNFIEDGCGKDDTLRYNYDNKASQQRFSFESFRFIKFSVDRVHLHCELVVCRQSDEGSVCARGCEAGGKTRRRRAAVREAPREVLTVGPLDFAQVQSASGLAAGPVSTTAVTAIAATMGLLVLVLIAAIVIVVRRRRAPPSQCKPVLLVQE